MGASERIVERIRREGPIPYDGFVEIALYGDDGFFTRARGAGRAGRDFVTSPEVGPLFGALVARALDGWWRELDAPDPFLVVEVGAGRGRLAARRARGRARVRTGAPVRAGRTLPGAPRRAARAAPGRAVRGRARPGRAHRRRRAAARSPAWARSSPRSTSSRQSPLDGVVLANELLDNLPFRIVERTADGWAEVRVRARRRSARRDGRARARRAGGGGGRVAADAVVPVGTRLPVPTRITDWLHSCAIALRHGVLVVVDYVATARGAGRARPRRLVAHLPGARAGRSTARRARRSGHHGRRARGVPRARRRAGPASSSPPPSRRPSGSRRSASKRSWTVRARRGTPAPTSATSRPSASAAASPRPPPSSTPPASARTGCSSSPADRRRVRAVPGLSLRPHG